MTSEDPLAPQFFARPCEVVARDLLGRWLRLGPVTVQITETEAYLGPADTACHTARGRTPRNAAMWGPLGRAYVYRCYGIHWLLNVVCGHPGAGAAALIRSGAVLTGLPEVSARRGGRHDLTGPGKLAQGLGIDGTYDHAELSDLSRLHLLAGDPATTVHRGARIGVDYAAPADRDALLRFADLRGPVTRPRKLFVETDQECSDHFDGPNHPDR